MAKGDTVKCSVLSVLVVSLVVLLAGCGGEEQAEELTAPTEKTEIIEQTTTTQAPPGGEEEVTRRGAGDTSSTTMRIVPDGKVPTNEQIESSRLDCQTLKAQQAEGQEAVDAYIREAATTGTTLAKVLSGRGYECTDGEIRVMQRQD
jgi:hypothetical protein